MLPALDTTPIAVHFCQFELWIDVKLRVTVFYCTWLQEDCSQKGPLLNGLWKWSFCFMQRIISLHTENVNKYLIPNCTGQKCSFCSGKANMIYTRSRFNHVHDEWSSSMANNHETSSIRRKLKMSCLANACKVSPVEPSCKQAVYQTLLFKLFDFSRASSTISVKFDFHTGT